MKRTGSLCIVLLCLITTQISAQVTVGEKGKLSGNVFADYYWIAQNNNADLEDKNGFWFRRIYLTYDRQISGAFSSRLRLEMASAGDFESDPKMIPNVKDAYLKWQNDRHQVLAGISSTPTWGLVEGFWRYRSVEKTPLDLYNFGSSRDFGLSFEGKLDKAGKVDYHFFLGNGNSNRPEINKGKKFMLSLGYNITEHIVVEGYADWNNDPNGLDSYVAQLFAGYRSDKFTIGALGAYRELGSFDDIQEVTLDLASLFTHMSLSDKVRVFLRADHRFDGYTNGSDNSYLPFAEGVESTFMVGGADILIEKNIHLMPNIEAIVYGENAFGQSPDTDIIPRLTLSYKF